MNTAISEANAATESAKTQTEAAQKAGTDASTAAQAANTQAQRLANMNIQAQTREYGSGSTAQMADSEGKLVLTLGIERGAPGVKGDKGEKGDKGDTGPIGARFQLSGGILYITTT